MAGCTGLIGIMLLEQHEFDLLQVLGRAVKQRGMEWHHLPIKDVSIPDARPGRAGLVATLLLVERGAPALQAASSVRALRSGAIETLAQEKYVRRCAENRERARGQ